MQSLHLSDLPTAKFAPAYHERIGNAVESLARVSRNLRKIIGSILDTIDPFTVSRVRSVEQELPLTGSGQEVYGCNLLIIIIIKP